MEQSHAKSPYVCRMVRSWVWSSMAPRRAFIWIVRAFRARHVRRRVHLENREVDSLQNRLPALIREVPLSQLTVATASLHRPRAKAKMEARRTRRFQSDCEQRLLYRHRLLTDQTPREPQLLREPVRQMSPKLLDRRASTSPSQVRTMMALFRRDMSRECLGRAVFEVWLA